MIRGFMDGSTAMPQLTGASPSEDVSSQMIRHSVLQGDYEVSCDPHLVLTTVLGSCISCCLLDPFRVVGGMNHFLLAEPPAVLHDPEREARLYGTYAMEQLVHAMLKCGATRKTMRAHLYGGAHLHAGMRAIGTENAQFAQRFLYDEGITLMHADTGGTLARRLDYQPATGRVRCRVVNDDFAMLPNPVEATASGNT